MSSGTVDSAQIDFQLNLIQPSSTSWQWPSKGNNETAHYKENKITVGIVRENARIQGPRFPLETLLPNGATSTISKKIHQLYFARMTLLQICLLNYNKS